jgi:hypothetical protein
VRWTYGPDYADTATGRRNQTRLLFGDTNPDFQLIFDEEVDYFLDARGDNVTLAAIECARNVGIRYSNDPTIAARMQAVIAALRATSGSQVRPRIGGVDQADFDARDNPSGTVPKNFRIHGDGDFPGDDPLVRRQPS